MTKLKLLCSLSCLQAQVPSLSILLYCKLCQFWRLPCAYSKGQLRDVKEVLEMFCLSFEAQYCS